LIQDGVVTQIQPNTLVKAKPGPAELRAAMGSVTTRENIELSSSTTILPTGKLLGSFKGSLQVSVTGLSGQPGVVAQLINASGMAIEIDTQSNSTWRAKTLSAGSYKLMVSASGYKSVVQSIVITPKDTLSIDLDMEAIKYSSVDVGTFDDSISMVVSQTGTEPIILTGNQRLRLLDGPAIVVASEGEHTVHTKVDVNEELTQLPLPRLVTIEVDGIEQATTITLDQQPDLMAPEFSGILDLPGQPKYTYLVPFGMPGSISKVQYDTSLHPAYPALDHWYAERRVFKRHRAINIATAGAGVGAIVFGAIFATQASQYRELASGITDDSQMQVFNNYSQQQSAAIWKSVGSFSLGAIFVGGASVGEWLWVRKSRQSARQAKEEYDAILKSEVDQDLMLMK